MSNSLEPQDEDIVQATQTELSFFMVLVFVMLLGFYLSSSEQKAGSGEIKQGGMEPGELAGRLDRQVKGLQKANQSLKDALNQSSLALAEKDAQIAGLLKRHQSVPPQPVARLGGGDKGEADAVSRGPGSGGREDLRSKCQHRVEGDRITLPNNLDERNLLFAQGRAEINQSAMECLVEFCPFIIGEFKKRATEVDLIRIEGHTNSKWNSAKGCPPIAAGNAEATDEQARAIAFECNLDLSDRRARAIHAFCRDYNRRDRLIPEDVYASRFLAQGQGSRTVRRDAAGRELEADSRRVEFLFVFKDAPAAAQRSADASR